MRKGSKMTPEQRLRISEGTKKAMVKFIGIPLSLEVKEKISASHKLRTRSPLSESHKKHIGEASSKVVRTESWKTKISISLTGKRYPERCGENHHNWKGGTTRRPVNSFEYKEWVSAVLLRDEYTCQVCDQRGGDLHVDHIKQWSKYPELRYEIKNGRVLCRPCHYYVTFNKLMPDGSRWGIRKNYLVSD